MKICSISFEGSPEVEPVSEIDLSETVNRTEALGKVVIGLDIATRNTPLAQQRLLELADEMAEAGFL